MVLLEDEIYEETKRILSGKFKISPILNELNEWFSNIFSINLINFEFNKLKHTQKTYRLLLIFRTTDDKNKMFIEPFKPNEQYQKIIAEKFRELALKYNFTDRFNLEKIFVAFNDFSAEAKADANWKAFKKANKKIRNKFPVVWHMISEFESPVIFYFNDNDILTNEENGTSKKIIDEYYSILKKYDEFGYFSVENFIIKFDSKENLDNNYEGNLFYYSK